MSTDQSNTPQAEEVLRLGAEHLHPSHQLDRPRVEVAQLQARCHDFLAPS